VNVTYAKYELVDQGEILPAWEVYWPGDPGCGDRHVYYPVARNPTAPPAQVYDTYCPKFTTVVRDPHHYNGKRKTYPPYEYTPYQISTRTTEQFLVRRLNSAPGGEVVYYQYGILPRIGLYCTPTPTSAPSTGLRLTRWNEVAHDFSCASYKLNEFSDAEILSAYRAAEDDAASDALTAYDILTDLAELREVPAMLSSISKDLITILNSLRGRFDKRTLRMAASMSPRDLLKSPHKLFRKFGDEWMTYRYGVMPLVYSYRDMVKLANRGSVVKTKKVRNVKITDTNVELPNEDTVYKVSKVEGSIRFSANVFQYFTSSEISHLSGLGVNPLLTAWELIPYSFVVDWFVDVGSYLTRKFAATFAATNWACLSRRDSYTTSTYVHLPNEDKSVPIANVVPFGWWGSVPENPPNEVLQNPAGLYLLKRETVNAYSRSLFDVRGARLHFDLSLNWKRLLDSSVMANNQLSSLIRRLRR